MIQQAPSSIDPARCPLCHGDNDCGVARGAGTCWCFSQPVPEGVIDRVPPELRGLACVCARCASGKRSAAEVQAIIDRLGHDR